MADRARVIVEACGLFRPLGRSARVGLATRGRVVEVARREVLVEQGEASKDVYLVGTGRIRALTHLDAERELTLAYRHAGELAGGQALFASTHTCELRASADLVALRLPVRALRKLMREDHDLGNSLLDHVENERAGLHRRLESLLAHTVEQRVAHLLVDLAAEHGVSHPNGILVGFKLTHLEIAQWVGSTRETVTLVLGNLRRKGLILTDQRRLIIKNANRLSKVRA